MDKTTDDEKSIHIFASAHPGYFGMRNRGGASKVYQDWDKINAWMK